VVVGAGPPSRSAISGTLISIGGESESDESWGIKSPTAKPLENATLATPRAAAIASTTFQRFDVIYLLLTRAATISYVDKKSMNAALRVRNGKRG
jgi:hypothetical protein